MNVQRLLAALNTVTLAIKRKQYVSAEQLKVLRKGRAKLKKKLKDFIDPKELAQL